MGYNPKEKVLVVKENIGEEIVYQHNLSVVQMQANGDHEFRNTFGFLPDAGAERGSEDVTPFHRELVTMLKNSGVTVSDYSIITAIARALNDSLVEGEMIGRQVPDDTLIVLSNDLGGSDITLSELRDYPLEGAASSVFYKVYGLLLSQRNGK